MTLTPYRTLASLDEHEKLFRATAPDGLRFVFRQLRSGVASSERATDAAAVVRGRSHLRR
jgi:CubicO group peptidase (beta-lactamase class C family)